MINKEIVRPNSTDLNKYILKWEKLENYVAQENAINDLFLKVYPFNTNIVEVITKCSVLNDFYSTNIFKIYDVAKHIVNINNIDDRLSKGDISLIEEIANIDMINDDNMISHYRFYSFATKYCSHHNEKAFPIYDSYVHRILVRLNKEFHFSNFKSYDLKCYDKYVSALDDFIRYFNLKSDYKSLDKYLWQWGKELL